MKKHSYAKLRGHLKDLINHEGDKFNFRINSIEEKNKLRYDNIGKSTKIAKNLMEARLEGMNGFRKTLKDAQGTYLTRSEYTIQHEKLSDDIKSLRESRANTEGKASMSSVYISYLIALLAITISLIGFFKK